MMLVRSRQRWFGYAFGLIVLLTITGCPTNPPATRTTQILHFTATPNPVPPEGVTRLSWHAIDPGVFAGAASCSLSSHTYGEPDPQPAREVDCEDAQDFTITANVSFQFNVLEHPYDPDEPQPYLTQAVLVTTTATPVTVDIEPPSVTLPVNKTQSFTATVTGATDTNVTWTLTPNCGTLTGSGNTVTYTAPATDGTCVVTATSTADPSKSATASVTVWERDPLPDTLYDDFTDRDYGSNPTWTLVVAGNKDDDPTLNYVDVSNQYARFVSSNHDGRGGSVGLQIDVDIPVEDDTAIQFDALATFRDVGDGCGWTCREYPANVLLHLEDELGTMYRVIYGVNYGGAVQDQTGEGWRIITTAVDQGVWARDLTFRLRDAWPDATRITMVQIHGSGWNFDGGIDNIGITVTSVPSVTAISVDRPPAHWRPADHH